MLPSSVHVNTALTSFALGYGSQLGKFVADKLFPVIPTSKQADKYYILGMEMFDDHRSRAARPTGGKYPRVQHDYTTASFSCVDVGLEEAVDDTIQENADAGLDPKQDAIIIIREQMALMQELRVAAAVTAATGLSTDSALSGTNRWDNDNSNPIGDMQTLIDSVEDATGISPNKILMNKAVFKALRQHPDILERIKYGGTNVNPANVTPGMIAALMGVDEVVVAKPVYNSAKQGANRSLTAVWPKSVVALYVPPTPFFGVPTFGAQFSWRADTGGQDMIAEEYREDQSRSDVVRIRQNRDEVVVGAAFGARYTTVVS